MTEVLLILGTGLGTGAAVLLATWLLLTKWQRHRWDDWARPDEEMTPDDR